MKQAPVPCIKGRYDLARRIEVTITIVGHPLLNESPATARKRIQRWAINRVNQYPDLRGMFRATTEAK